MLIFPMKSQFPSPAALPTLDPRRMEELGSGTQHSLPVPRGKGAPGPSAHPVTIPLPLVPPRVSTMVTC